MTHHLTCPMHVTFTSRHIHQCLNFCILLFFVLDMPLLTFFKLVVTQPQSVKAIDLPVPGRIRFHDVPVMRNGKSCDFKLLNFLDRRRLRVKRPLVWHGQGPSQTAARPTRPGPKTPSSRAETVTEISKDVLQQIGRAPCQRLSFRLAQAPWRGREGVGRSESGLGYVDTRQLCHLESDTHWITVGVN